MISIALSNSFKRAYSKLIKNNKQLEELFFNRLETFINNPFDPSLKTHKLSGKLSECWSFSINFQLRVVFVFIDTDQVILENIGNHDNVY